MEQQKFGMTIKKSEKFSEWYQQVVLRSELLSYYDIRGCFIMRPAAMAIWNEIKGFFDAEIRKLGVSETYFPMLVTKKNLETEKTHLSSFDPELAWITKCGDEDLAEPVALRPTSEAIMYPSYAKWIKTYRDLPLKLNQWCSVVRWEVKSTLPFIRAREFLWQEGHTAFYKKQDAEEEVGQILDLYARVYEELLAVPVTKGRKSKNETFGGAEYTYSIEAFIPGSGKGVQAATSHHLGQNFAKMFDMKVETECAGAEKQYVYQNSWGITTRSLGIAAMIHSDDNGFVCPPYVSEIQAVVMLCGITAKTTAEKAAVLRTYAQDIYKSLKEHVRVHFDDRDHLSPGFKFNHWELRGVPLRIEVGFKDLGNSTVRAVRRDNGASEDVQASEVLAGVCKILDTMHKDMYKKALAEKKERTVFVESFADLESGLNKMCQIMAPWCELPSCEDEISRRTTIYKEDGTVEAQGAKSLCIPFEKNDCTGKACVNCGAAAKCYTLFGRSY
ncbi:bifunctional glutamyl/prolyl-tRNA synthetase [Pancytospora philotis]|nr:bifunctional glutamyl/prolyl-tRNA synthetase [Pancytospora philotis]